jgi:hypothetical protein
MLLLVLAAFAAFAGHQLRGGRSPDWLDFAEFQISRRFFEIAAAAALVLTFAAEAVAYAYGVRQQALSAAAQQASAAEIQQLRKQQQQARRRPRARTLREGELRPAAEAGRGREPHRRA